MKYPKVGDYLEPNGIRIWQVLDNQEVIGNDGFRYKLTEYLTKTTDKFGMKWQVFQSENISDNIDYWQQLADQYNL